jgi:hypothetical protein
MSDLLQVAVGAHGDLDRWNSVTSIDVAASISGAIWYVKGKGDALKNVGFKVDTTRELLTMDFVGHDRRSIFEPFRFVMHRRDGVLIDSRDDPEGSFDGQVYDTPWGRHSRCLFQREGAMGVAEYTIPLHLARICHRRDHPDPGWR